MKTKKKTIPASQGHVSVDDIINEGSSTKLEEKLYDAGKNERRGRPKSEVPKKTCSFRLPLDIVDAIDHNNRGGNKSVFLEEIIRDYFNRHNIDI